MAIPTQRIGNRIVSFINGKLYETQVEQDDILDVFEHLANLDPDNEEDLKEAISIFKPSADKEQLELFAEEKGLVHLDRDEDKSLIEWFKEIESVGDPHFEVKDFKLLFKGINIPIPKFLAIEIEKRRNNEEDLMSFINFWKLLALNPDARCREDLYKFLDRNKLSITPSGYFVAYRSVVLKKDVDTDKALKTFVKNEYTKVKAWKKSPKNYIITYDGRGMYFREKQDSVISEGKISMGNLDDLYNDLIKNDDGGDEKIYTDGHTRTMTIKMGQPVSQDRSKCDGDPERTCSHGLHFATYDYWINHFGNVTIAVLVNPMHVVAVPYDGGQKGRCCEYLPICELSKDEDGNMEVIDTATFEYDYAEHTEEQIDEMLNNTRFESLKEHKMIPVELDVETLRNVYSMTSESVQEIKERIGSRKVVIN